METRYQWQRGLKVKHRAKLQPNAPWSYICGSQCPSPPRKESSMILSSYDSSQRSTDHKYVSGGLLQRCPCQLLKKRRTHANLWPQSYIGVDRWNIALSTTGFVTCCCSNYLIYNWSNNESSSRRLQSNPLNFSPTSSAGANGVRGSRGSPWEESLFT